MQDYTPQHAQRASPARECRGAAHGMPGAVVPRRVGVPQLAPYLSSSAVYIPKEISDSRRHGTSRSGAMASRRTGAPAAASLPARQTRGCATRCRSVREEGGGAGTYQVPGRGGKEWYFPEGRVPPFPACAVRDVKMAVRWLGTVSWRQSGQLRGRGRLQAPGSGRAQPGRCGPRSDGSKRGGCRLASR